MWSQDDKEVISKEELVKSLEDSFEAREYYGLVKDSEGYYGIGDLEKIKGFPEETKVILREVLRSHKKPKPAAVTTPPVVAEAPKEIKILTMPLVISVPKQKHPIPPSVREDLDNLYAKIDGVKPLTKKREREPGE